MAGTDIRRGSKKSILDVKIQQLAAGPDWATMQAALADTIFNDITTNPYLIQFDTLNQVTTTGYWNQESQRIEC